MKKLIAMIGAVAMSFGLFAASPASFTISFEGAESTKGISDDGTFNPNAEGVTGWTWTGDPFALSQYAGEVLPYTESGDKARRHDKFVGFDTNDNYLPLSTGSDELTRAVNGNLYLDQLVKFTGFEDPQTNLVAGTKIAIWMSEFENDDESTSTNLYVTVGKLANGEVKQIALKVDGTYSLDTWYRLTVKSLGNIYTESASTVAAGFLVYVNGQKVASSDDAALDLTDKVGEMTVAAQKYMEKKQLFTSIAADATFTSVGYQGIGAIDDIIVDAKGPDFCVETVETVDVTFADITGAVITKVVDSDGTVFTDFTSAISVKPGKLTVTLAAAKGYKMTSSGEYIVDVSAAGQLKVTVAKGDFVEVYATKNGTVEYGADELYGMITGLVDGDVVVFNLESTIKDDEQNQLYGAPAGSRITVSVLDGVTTWAVYVAGEMGTFTDNVGADAATVKNFTFEDEGSGALSLGGNVAGAITALAAEVVANIEVSGMLEVAFLTATVTFTLDGEGKVRTTTPNDVQNKIRDGAGIAVVPTAEAGWYTYALSDVPPEKIEYVTFTVTYDTAKVENVTVKTNGADVVNVEGVYTVESNAVVTVAATAKTGYQNVTIARDNVTVDAGVFKADKASSVITIAAEEIPPATYDITFATVENGTLETSVTNGIAAGTTVTVIATPATGYECTQITTNGTAITGTSFEMPAGDVEIGATFTLQQFTVAAITVANASVVATNKTAGGATLTLPADLLRDTEIAVTVTPNANYEYATTPAGWTKNEDGSITTNATVTANLAITVEAPTAAITPVDPGELIKGKTPEEVNANLDKYLKVPEIQGIDADTYRAMFAAKKSGADVVIDLNPDVEVLIQGELNAATATVLAPDETGKATITARIGLYYGIKAAGEVGSVDTEAVQNGVQATTTKLKITVPTADSKATPFTDKAFFKTICSPKAFK